MKRIIGLFIIMLVALSSLNAQDFQCSVSINANQISSSGNQQRYKYSVSHSYFLHNTISSVPAPISIHPSRDLTVNCSCKKINASRMVMTTDSLSTGTTFEASPICSALK